MSCCITKIDFCQLSQETWRIRSVEFDQNISSDTFEWHVWSEFKMYDETFTIDNGIERVGNKILLQDPELSEGSYKQELLWIRDGKSYLVFQGSITIKSSGNCKDCNEDMQVSLSDCYITLKEGDNYNIILNYDDLTPEQKAELKGDSGWTPVIEAETNGDKIVYKLTDYIGGEGDKPTDHIGDYLTDSGWTSDINQALDFKGEKGEKGDKGEKGIQGIQGEKGDKGDTGTGLDYNWNGTELGVKREDEANYQYTDLKGEQGEKGETGATGAQGDTPYIQDGHWWIDGVDTGVPATDNLQKVVSSNKTIDQTDNGYTLFVSGGNLTINPDNITSETELSVTNYSNADRTITLTAKSGITYYLNNKSIVDGSITLLDAGVCWIARNGNNIFINGDVDNL